MTENIVILGAGYSAKAFAAARPGRAAAIAGTTRSEDRFGSLEQAGMEPLLFNGEPSPALAESLREAAAVIVSIPPDETGDPVAKNLFFGDVSSRMPRLRWIAYLSTVGVYGDHAGRWVDETSPCRPVSRRSVLRLEAEREWLDVGRRSDAPVAVLRLAGIYGPGRNAMVNLAHGTARRLVKPGQVFNRIHVADIAGALWHLMGQGRGGVFNVTDDLPAPPQDVVAYAAGLAGMEAPPEIPFDAAVITSMARSFYGENKRVSNAALKACGYHLRFPDYRSALDAMWAEGNWAGAGEADARSPMKFG